MTIPILAVALRLCWLAFEIPWLRRYRIKSSKDWDKNSARLWDLANALEPIGLILGFLGVGQILSAARFVPPLGLGLLIVGIAIRSWAVYSLGKFFTGTVVIKDDHRLIRDGLYRYIRHPAYTGTLIAHLGLGLSFSNWFSLALSSVPYFVAAFYRMHIEEQALTEAFGDEYVDYSNNTKRLLPGIY